MLNSVLVRHTIFAFRYPLFLQCDSNHSKGQRYDRHMGKHGGRKLTPHPRTAQIFYQKMYVMSEDLNQLAEQVKASIINCFKEVLTSDEAAAYCGFSKSYLYKLTMRRQIPHFKPAGKMCYFNRKELEDWLQSNRIATDEEISMRANAYCMQKGGRNGR